MPIRDQAAQERSLDNDYGTTRAAAAPAAFEVAGFAGDPSLGGVEVSGGGYARGVLSNDDWLAADGGIKTSLPVAFPAPTGAWSATVTHVGLFDPVEAAWWDVVPLVEPLDITGAGDPPSVVVSILYANNLD